MKQIDFLKTIEREASYLPAYMNDKQELTKHLMNIRILVAVYFRVFTDDPSKVSRRVRHTHPLKDLWDKSMFLLECKHLFNSASSSVGSATARSELFESMLAVMSDITQASLPKEFFK